MSSEGQRLAGLLNAIDDAKEDLKFYRFKAKMAILTATGSTFIFIGGSAAGSISGIFHVDIGGLCCALIIMGICGMAGGVAWLCVMYGEYSGRSAGNHPRRVLRRAERAYEAYLTETT